MEGINVCVRMRPLLPPYEDEELWMADPENKIVFTKTSQNARLLNSSSSSLRENDKRLKYFEKSAPQSFAFDSVFGQEATSSEVYNQIGQPVVHRVLNGYNGTIFMYGQTTSGKTYTMLGTPEAPGILPCSLRELFSYISQDTSQEFKLWVSYLEIYNEQINDLLDPGNNNLRIQEDPLQGIVVQDLTQQEVFNFEEVIMLMNYGEEHRAYRETTIHEHSSRSHTIFKVYLESRSVIGGRIRFGCLNLIDLAGSERINEVENSTTKAGEISHINKSLFVLAHVVNKLAEGKNKYIHYRDSKLTRMLSMALGGNSLCSIVCTVSPAANNFQQTLSTLRFASQAKKIKNNPHINEILNEDTEKKELTNKLEQELKQTVKINQNLEEERDDLIRRLRDFQEELERKEEENSSIKQELEHNKRVMHSLQEQLDSQQSVSGDYETVFLQYAKEKEARNKLEIELESHRQALVEAIQSEHGTLQHLNELISESGGNPIEIPTPEFTGLTLNPELNYIHNLILDDWSDEKQAIAQEYAEELFELQKKYREQVHKKDFL